MSKPASSSSDDSDFEVIARPASELSEPIDDRFIPNMSVLVNNEHALDGYNSSEDPDWSSSEEDDSTDSDESSTDSDDSCTDSEEESDVPDAAILDIKQLSAYCHKAAAQYARIFRNKVQPRDEDNVSIHTAVDAEADAESEHNTAIEIDSDSDAGSEHTALGIDSDEDMDEEGKKEKKEEEEAAAKNEDKHCCSCTCHDTFTAPPDFRLAMAPKDADNVSVRTAIDADSDSEHTAIDSDSDDDSGAEQLAPPVEEAQGNVHAETPSESISALNSGPAATIIKEYKIVPQSKWSVAVETAFILTFELGLMVTSCLAMKASKLWESWNLTTPPATRSKKTATRDKTATCPFWRDISSVLFYSLLLSVPLLAIAFFPRAADSDKVVAPSSQELVSSQERIIPSPEVEVAPRKPRPLAALTVMRKAKRIADRAANEDAMDLTFPITLELSSAHSWSLLKAHVRVGGAGISGSVSLDDLDAHITFVPRPGSRGEFTLFTRDITVKLQGWQTYRPCLMPRVPHAITMFADAHVYMTNATTDADAEHHDHFDENGNRVLDVRVHHIKQEILSVECATIY